MSQKACGSLVNPACLRLRLTTGIQSRNKPRGGFGVKQDSNTRDRVSQFESAGGGAPASALPAARNIDPPSAPGGRSSAGASAATVVDPEWLEATFSRLRLLLCTIAGSNELGRLLLRELAPALGAVQAALYVMDTRTAREDAELVLEASYAAGRDLPERWALGEGLVGQCARDREKLVVRGVASEFFRVRSALGSSAPAEIAFVPVWLDPDRLSVVELAFADAVTPARDALLDRLAAWRPWVAPLAHEAGSRGATTPQQPSGVRTLIRTGHRSGFWGKLSHELRSPLNSVLVLSQLLAENAEANLNPKQIAFATAIHNSGNDLLALVNAISDLAKIQNNRLVLEPTEMVLDHFRAHLERAFQPVAEARGLDFRVELEPGLPEVIVTDAKRVRQVLKNLLSNAFKFTESGGVSVRVGVRSAGWPPEHERLTHAHQVLSVSVSDTGVGMSENEQDSIFEAFPPERVEARRGAGASGLGLAISRELARLLGGTLQVESQVGSGSTFTLFLPVSGLIAAGPEEPPPESGTARPARDSGLMLVAPAAGATADGSSGSGLGSVVPADVAADAGHSQSAPGAELVARRLRPAQLAGHNVLLVDDDVRSAFALTGALERQGAEVSHAEDVGEALSRLEAGLEASAMLIDADLIDAGGMVSSLLPYCRRLPVIVLTRVAASGSSLPPEIHQLVKPVDTQQLLRVLTAVVSARPGL
jgi:signal transduction histidine kinase/CheY-like chemotaxis protein